MVILLLTDAEVCYRKYVDKKEGCRGLMRRRFKSPESCCKQGKAAGFAIKEKSIDKRLFSCTSCSTLQNNNNIIRNLPLRKTISYGPAKDGWSSWSDWSPCSKTCMAGFQTRERRCLKGLDLCKGKTSESRACSLRTYCPIDGEWGPWYPWKPCSASCGGGTQERYRQCNNPPPLYGGHECEGNSTKIRECKVSPCPVDGKWTEWAPYSDCSVTCGTGIKARMRECNDPPPAYGGQYCKGKPYQHKKCHERQCPINGGWSLWSSWSHLTVSCGEGTVKRTRKCISPKPQFGGMDCEGESVEVKRMNSTKSCPIDGGWSEWTPYGPCRANACQTGVHLRSRSCSNPRPMFGGKYCTGNLIDRQECVNNVDCIKVDGGWCEWSPWSECSITCGSENDISFHKRTRECACPAPKNGGGDCNGVRFETENCDINECESHHNLNIDDDVILTDIRPTDVEPEMTTEEMDELPLASGNGKTQGSGCGVGGSGDGSDGSDAACDQEPDDPAAPEDADIE